ncbi:MAG: glycosidase [Kiritimatiellae bacterium]|nr:glycosidase [Kiritimatiellia bacterium]
MKLKKWQDNPILEPTGTGDWEKLAVCNPGAIRKNGQVCLLYRASGETDDYRIHFGLAVSDDGFHFERVSDRPIYPQVEPYEAGCVEDPRIIAHDGWFYITYACRAVPYTQFTAGRGPKYPPDAPRALRENLTRTALMRTRDMRTFERLGPITGDDVDDRDVVIFPEKINGKYVMLHRPAHWIGPEYGCDKASIWMAFSDDMVHWADEHLLAQPDPDAPWQERKVGASTPPIKTEHGWLVMYHGVQGTGPARTYRQGVMMLDLEDPRKIISRPLDFILEPTENFEKQGVEHNVVFATANLVIGDELFVYYGGADKVCCAATCRLADLVDFAMSRP